ncbi:hypothetical protein HWV62_27548 [Athelia sp. TMB]|nr:hypothetical protein HWV62_27548 [Athelia sp. TMB]
MPRKSIERPSVMPTRRSARLHKDNSALSVASQKPFAQHTSEPQTKKRKTKLAPIDTHVFTVECNKEVLGASASNVPPTPISPLSHTPRSSEDLHQREHDLLARELELKRKSEQLDLQEQKASEMIEKCELKSAETTLALLDEHFTCSLCYETMACPYVLHPLKCGHTFDAICILRWFFSKAHQACGGWHEYVACPICRSQLIVTPERIPRHEITFPFIPNRTVDAALKDLIGKLEHAGTNLKREPGAEVVRRPKVKREDGDVASALDGWRSGGSTRKDWLRREKLGREEMAYLTMNWTKLSGQDFIVMKARLQV